MRQALYSRQLEGCQPTVVFLGGFRSSCDGIKACALEAHCRHQQRAFIAFDYRGHGRSPGNFEAHTLSDWLADSLYIMDALDGPLVVVGSSMGAWLMLLAAECRPERMHGLLSLACAVDFTETLLWGSLSEHQRRQLLDGDTLWLPSHEAGEPPWPLRWAFIEDARRFLLQARPISPPCPLVLLHGMEDATIDWQTSLTLCQGSLHPQTRLTLLRDGGHRLSREQDLALICRELDQLCAS